jgi:hypothetical protein
MRQPALSVRFYFEALRTLTGLVMAREKSQKRGNAPVGRGAAILAVFSTGTDQRLVLSEHSILTANINYGGIYRRKAGYF